MAGLVVVGLSGCQQNATTRSGASLDQNKLCQVDTWKPVTVANGCEAGQKVVFRPGQSAADNASVLFAAANCDMRYSVVVTPAGATCVYKPIRSTGKLGAPAAVVVLSDAAAQKKAGVRGRRLAEAKGWPV